MKAIIQNGYGSLDRLQIQEIEKPTPKDGEALVKVYASSINAGNVFAVRGTPIISRFWTGLGKPKFLNSGSDVAGVVEAVGADVSVLKPGDAVFGDNQLNGSGTFAEYVCVPEHELALKPANITFAEAGTVPQAAMVALQGLRDVGQIQAGQKVLITGASGGNGTFAVQIAKAFGAEVTAVCSTRNLDLVRSIGADYVIDYTTEDFARGTEQYDLIIAMGGYRKLKDYELALKPGGIFVWAGGELKGLFQTMAFGPLRGRKSKKTMRNLTHKHSQGDLVYLGNLMKDEKVKPVIDSIFPLENIANAMSHYEAGHMQGKVVIIVAEEKENES